MKTATNAQPTKATGQPTAEKLPYPSHGPYAKFDWLCWYFRDIAKAEALNLAYHKALNLCKYDAVLTDALHEGALALKKESLQSLQYAIEEGLLLFAWTGTTIFKNTQVAA